MTREKVQDMSQHLDWKNQIRYRKAVKGATVTTVDQLELVDLQHLISEEHVNRIICEEGTMPRSVWSRRSLYSWRLPA